MSDLELESYDSKRSIQTWVKIGLANRSLMIPQALPHSQVKRLIEVDEEENVAVAEGAEDDLAEAIVEAAESLSHTERVGNREVDVNPTASLAALFDSTPEARALKPKLFLALSTSTSDPEIVGMLLSCSFSRDPTLSTEKFTQQYCSDNGIPRLSNALLIDVVASSDQARGAGTLLVTSAYLSVTRSRTYDLLCTVAVTTAGKSLFNSLGFHHHSYREGTQRTFFWIRPGELKGANLHRRLRMGDSVSEVCWRRGAQARTADKRFPRC